MFAAQISKLPEAAGPLKLKKAPNSLCESTVTFLEILPAT